MYDVLRTYAATFWWLGVLSVLTFVGSLVAIPILVARIPADYFTRDPRDANRGHRRHPVLGFIGHLLKNFVGILFILAGLVMLVLPGQGIVTILVGITLMDFPGKRVLERRIVRQPAILRAVNWLRARVNQPELDMTQAPSCRGEVQPRI